MQNGFKSQHWVDEVGMPAGGISQGTGFVISWQNGPLGACTCTKGENRENLHTDFCERKAPNGAFVEDVIAAAKDRILWYQQDTRFKCDENDDALTYLQLALNRLSARTARRSTAGTEGTHLGS